MNHDKWSIPFFTWKGVPVRIHWILIIFAVFFIFRDNDPLAFRYNCAFVGILLITVIVHEFGHALMAVKVGGRAHKIILWPLGGLAFTSHNRGLEESLKITLAGPLTHIPLALSFAAWALVLGAPPSWKMFSPMMGDMPSADFWPTILMIGVKVQIFMLLFNLFVPAYPLDCGHAIVELMLLRGKSPQTTAKVIIAVSMVAAIVMTVVFKLFIVAMFVVYEVYRLHLLVTQNQLVHHPLFNKAMQMGSFRSRPVSEPASKVLSFKKKFREKKKEKAKKAAQRTCPTCKRSLPASAIMCGFCEKVVPLD